MVTTFAAGREDALVNVRRGRISYVFQQYHLLPSLTAVENVLLPLTFCGVCGEEEKAIALLDRVGNEPAMSIIVFTLDETSYARELAPLAGHYPALKLGPAWWFHDSPEGMRRFREQTTETAGFHNTVGFNDDTRAYLSIPARHDMARRVDCAFLSDLVATHRMDEDEAVEVAHDLAYGLAKKAYKL